MQQYIVREQVDALSPQEYERLFQWMLAQEDHSMLYRCSLGHLINFLDQHIAGWWRLQRDQEHMLWWVHSQDECFESAYHAEAIDALWEVTIQILRSSLFDKVA